MRRNCYLKTGLLPRDASKKCADISNYWWQGECYAFFAIKLNDVSLCNNDNNKVEARCYMYFVEKAENPDLNICEKKSFSEADMIYGNSYPGIWKNNCYYNLAFNMKNSSLCFKITKSIEVTNCLDNVQRMNQK